MKILIDVGHPAHVHYIKNFVHLVQKEGHEVLVVARERDFIFYLLKQYNINFVSRGSGSGTFLGKFFKFFTIVYQVLKIAYKYRPDIFFGMTSHYLAPVSKLLNKPYIAFDDTECSTLSFLISMPFVSHILTPKSFQKNLGKKQIKFNGYLKTCYLHKNYFKPNSKVLQNLRVDQNEKFIIFRFVAYDAYHDLGLICLSEAQKYELISFFSQYVKIFISSEEELNEVLKPYQILIPPEMMHDALHYSTLFIGQSGTMAVEAALVGTSSINILSKGEHKEGVILDLEQYELLSIIDFSATQLDEIIKTGNRRISFDNKEINQKLLKLVNDNSIDVTAFMVWFVTNYPDSVTVLREDPNYQLRFK